MNRKQFIYSFQSLAVMLSLFTFTSCEKDQFTAEDALALEEQRLRLQAELDAAAAQQEIDNMKDLQMFSHTIDSLNAANAGGLVWYSVSVVPGGSSAFSGGRYEEVGVNGVTVTAEQYGMVQTVTTQNGIAAFPMPFRSGEVTVTVDAGEQGYTSVHYISNLTPDGGVPNDGTVFVGNVMPVFENDPAVHGDDKMAMIAGNAYAELDLTNNFEEEAPEGTGFNAFIDVNNPAFWSEYIAEANEEGTNIGGNGTKSGHIQRVAYEGAAASGERKVNADGSYSMMVAATASGLPVKMRVSDFAADRYYFQFTEDDGDFGFVTKRFLYGPNVTPSPFVVGYLPTYFLHDAVFTLVDQEASVSVTLTSDGSLDRINVTAEGAYINDSGDWDSNLVPTVTISAPPAGGTQATAMVDEDEMVYVDDSGSGDTELYGLDLGTASIVLTNAGAGYTSAPTVTINRVATGGMGYGTLQAPSSSVTFIRVIDGGFGFKNPVAVAYNPGTYTGADFKVTIAPPAGTGVTATAYVPTLAGGDAFEGYDDEGTIVGFIVSNGGVNYNSAPAITFGYGEGATVPSVDEDGDPLFTLAGPGGNELNFDLAYDNVTLLNPFLASNSATFCEWTVGTGSFYAFAPSVVVSGGTIAAGGTQATMTAETWGADGAIHGLKIEDQGNYTAAATGVSFTPATNSLSAETVLAGGNVDNYVITDRGANYWTASPTFNPHADGYALTDNDYECIFEAPADADGSEAMAIARIVDNKLVGIEITDPGSMYASTAQPTFYVQEVGAADAKAKAYLSDAQLVFSIANGGLGYARRPQVWLYGGGINFDEGYDFQDPANFAVDVNNSGTVTSITYTGSTAQLGDIDITEEALTLVVSVEDEENDMNGYWFDGGAIGWGEVITNGDQITGFRNDTGDANWDFFWSTAAGMPFDQYIMEPNIIIVSGFGSGATGEFVLNTQDGTIKDMVVTSGGSGYINYMTNDPGADDDAPSNDGLRYADGEEFEVLGGPTDWEVYSGLSYVRDVHYGTGQVLE